MRPERRANLPWAALGCLAAVTSGCDTAAPSSSWEGSVTDSAGVMIVTSTGAGAWAPGESWSVKEDLRIGEFGGDPRYQFAQIGSIALNSSGHLIVVDRQTLEVREFTDEGDFVRAVGSPGRGPGEFARGVSDALVGAGDTLLVPDVRNRRVHRFDEDGDFLDAASLDTGSYRVLRFRWNAATGGAVAQVRYAVGDTSRAMSDELREVEHDGGLGRALLSLPSGGLFGAGGTLQYFTPEPIWGLTDSLTVIYGVTDRYRLGSYDRAGNLRMVVAREHQVRPITERDIRAFFVYLDRAWIAAGASPQQLEANHQLVSFAPTFPAFAAVHEGYQGTVWVQPVQPPGELSDEAIERYNFIEDYGGSRWEVFDREGRLLGPVAMPPGFQPRLFVDDAIYGVQRDELDVQYVVRVRIVAS